jgi:hypothetical protein
VVAVLVAVMVPALRRWRLKQDCEWPRHSWSHHIWRYVQFSETLINSFMESLVEPENDEDAARTEQELDILMKPFKVSMDCRPFLVNNILLRRNPNWCTGVGEAYRTLMQGWWEGSLLHPTTSNYNINNLEFTLLRHILRHWKLLSQRKPLPISIESISIVGIREYNSPSIVTTGGTGGGDWLIRRNL